MTGKKRKKVGYRKRKKAKRESRPSFHRPKSGFQFARKKRKKLDIEKERERLNKIRHFFHPTVDSICRKQKERKLGIENEQKRKRESDQASTFIPPKSGYDFPRTDRKKEERKLDKEKERKSKL